MWLVLGIAAVVAVACALKARAAAAPSSVPPGSGAVPPGSGTPTAASDNNPSVGVLAVSLNDTLHTYGSAPAATLIAQFQASTGLPATGLYDTATARALAAFVTQPPAPDS